MENKIIKINCNGSREVSIDELLEFQGNLKSLDQKEYNKLKQSIIEYGFSFPVFVWDNNKILDGHTRIFVIRRLLKEGFSIGNIPVVDIQAKDQTEAKEKLLILNSKYGKITEEGLSEFIDMSGIDFESLSDKISLDHEIKINVSQHKRTKKKKKSSPSDADGEFELHVKIKDREQGKELQGRLKRKGFDSKIVVK